MTAQLNAVAHVTLTKLDACGNVISIEEQDIPLTVEEVNEVCRSLQQD